MGIATINSSHHYNNSMSHQHHDSNIFGFSNPNGFDRSVGLTQQDQIHDTSKLMLRGFQPTPPPPVYDQTPGMLSEMDMYHFGHGTDILDYRRQPVGGMVNSEWHQDTIGGDHNHHHHHHHHHHHQQQQEHNDPTPPPPPTINAESAAAMQLFLTNPQPRSPSPSSQPAASSSTLHMLLPTPSEIQAGSGGGFHPTPNFWAPHINNSPPGLVEGQGLSLSLSSSLQHLEAAKHAEEFRNMGSGDTHMGMFFSQVAGSNSNNNSTTSQGHFLKHLAGNHILQGNYAMPGPNMNQVHLGFGSALTSSSSMGVVNVLRNSRYARPAQELLEEFCSVGRGHLKKSELARQQNSVNQNLSSSDAGGGPSSTKDPAQLSPADRIEHQRRKVKLIAMLDEVERRYSHYCEQMQMVVNSFDMVMGYGGAVPYTALAQKAMSRHFRCLKDAVGAQLKQSCDALGEKDPTASTGLTKGETPRLKLLEQSLRQQRAFHQMGMMEQDAWRPQRGLPERSVNILRAWLFDHFLHPYPSDADKHLLARQTGLSRNQVSNWFINARVRLWKPMVEEMYQQESKQIEEEEKEEEERERNQQSSSSNTNSITTHSPQNPMLSSSSASASASVSVSTQLGKRCGGVGDSMTPTHDTNHQNRHHQLPPPQPPYALQDACQFGIPTADNVGSTTMIRFGTSTGDVSLTLGLRHAGNAPDQNTPFRDFGNN